MKGSRGERERDLKRVRGGDRRDGRGHADNENEKNGGGLRLHAWPGPGEEECLQVRYQYQRVELRGKMRRKECVEVLLATSPCGDVDGGVRYPNRIKLNGLYPRARRRAQSR